MLQRYWRSCDAGQYLSQRVSPLLILLSCSKFYSTLVICITFPIYTATIVKSTNGNIRMTCDDQTTNPWLLINYLSIKNCFCQHSDYHYHDLYYQYDHLIFTIIILYISSSCTHHHWCWRALFRFLSVVRFQLRSKCEDKQSWILTSEKQKPCNEKWILLTRKFIH